MDMFNKHQTNGEYLTLCEKWKQSIEVFRYYLLTDGAKVGQMFRGGTLKGELISPR